MSEEQVVARARQLRGKEDGELMALYVKLRDTIEAKNKEFKEEQAKRVSLMEQIEGVILERLNERKTTSTASDEFVAFKEPVTYCGVSDWDQVLAWVLEEAQYHFLNHSVNKNAVREYLDEHDDPPPGVKWTEETSLKIRRK